MNVEMGLIGAARVSDGTQELSHSHRFTNANAHRRHSKMREHDVHPVAIDHDMIAGHVGPVILRNRHVLQAIGRGDYHAAARSYDRCTEDPVRRRIRRHETDGTPAIPVDRDDVHGVTISAPRPQSRDRRVERLLVRVQEDGVPTIHDQEPSPA